MKIDTLSLNHRQKIPLESSFWGRNRPFKQRKGKGRKSKENILKLAFLPLKT